MADLNHLFLLVEQAQREKGDAQHQITVRNKKLKKLKELDEWVSTYKRIARLVFENNPQHLEKLGMVVKS